jgi:ribosome-binding ATPase YchF (GTP1/OBG family)
MKIGMVGIEGLSGGKINLIDKRLDTIQKMFNSAKKVYIQAELITENEKLKEADGLLSAQDTKADFILTDLEFVENRLERTEDEAEKKLLNRFREVLDKEKFISELTLTEEEMRSIYGYTLLTTKPIFLATATDLEDKDKLLLSAYTYFGYLSFFTATEKEAHAWSLKKGSNAWDAAGCIHSDIQRGFIRAEVVGFQDLINDGSLSQARNHNHLRLENKDYIVQDADFIFFRFNK